MMIDGENEDELLLTPDMEEGQEAEVKTPEDQEDEVGITLDIEGEDDGDETPLVKTLRDRARDLARENADLRKAQQPAPVDPGPEPTLEGCEWDEEKFKAEWRGWNERQSRASTARQQQEEVQHNQNQEFERLKLKHQQRAAALRIPNFDASEKALMAVLGPELTGAALVMATDSAKLVAAVGSKPALLAKLDAEPNPLRKLAMLKDWEHRIVVNRKKPPEPEAGTITRSTASISQPKGDAKAEKLLDEAQRTGNMNKYRAYMKSKKAA